MVCISKLDLSPSDREFQEALAVYRTIGYPVVMVSAHTGEGLSELTEALHGRVSVLVGKSGVGKSSLLNALQPGLDLQSPTSHPWRKRQGTAHHHASGNVFAARWWLSG